MIARANALDFLEVRLCIATVFVIGIFINMNNYL